MARLQRVEDDKEKYLKELDALEVVVISDADFEVTPLRDFAPSDRVMAEAGTVADQHGTFVPQDTDVVDVTYEAEEESGDCSTKDPTTGKELAPLFGNPVTQDAPAT
ncbi:unnamed protein product [Arabis nemorensis]|uniref:Uncharacterized protein n=1 Tax=Arabis nemorensis TaxID=586526 RepID=A0A565B4X2_9BRAS|nr:unnamed protein product [Arabis nemorensis]